MRIQGADEPIPWKLEGELPKLTYAELEQILTKVFHAETEERTNKLRWKYKHLQRLGIPLGRKPGKGSKLKYTVSELCQWIVALELSELGMDPMQVVDMMYYLCHAISENGIYAMRHFRMGLLAERKDGFSDYLIFHTRLMTGTWDTGYFDDPVQFWVLSEQECLQHVKQSGSSHTFMINIDTLAGRLRSVLEDPYGLDP